jgi:hypothetical protein
MRKSISVALASLLCSLGTAQAQQNPNDKLCFREHIGVPGHPNPPTIDGVVDVGDPSNPIREYGWTNAFRFIANPSGSPNSTDVAAQGILGNGALYLSFEVKNDPRLDPSDAIAITFGGGEGSSTLLVIKPFQAHGGAANFNGPADYWETRTSTGLTNNCMQWSSSPVVKPTWVTTAVRSGNAGVTLSWNVEIRLQLSNPDGPSGLDVNGSGFTFFYDVNRIENETIINPSTGEPAATPFPWPRAAQVGACEVNGPLFALTPPVTQWGTGTINSGSCGGIAFSPSDIRTDNPSGPTAINKNGPNRFSVKLHNDAVDTRPGPNFNHTLEAQQISARFRIANFGLPPDPVTLKNRDWMEIPGANLAGPLNVPAATTNPPGSAVPPGSIATAGSATLQTPSPGWTPDPTWTSVNSGHQCILVELSSTTDDTIFVNRSAWQNMNYTSNPGEPAPAVISARGYGTPADRSSNQTFDLLMVASTRYVFGDGTVSDIGIGRLAAQIVYTLNGYRWTDRHVTIGAQRFTITEPVGYFGYLVQHEMGQEFQQGYESRHQNAMNYGRDFSGPETERWARVNRFLENDPERPSATDWHVSIPRLPIVADSNGVRGRVSVPTDGEITLKPTIRHGKKCLCFLCCNDIPIVLTTAGMFGLSFFAFRRRRDEEV